MQAYIMFGINLSDYIVLNKDLQQAQDIMGRSSSGKGEKGKGGRRNPSDSNGKGEGKGNGKGRGKGNGKGRQGGGGAPVNASSERSRTARGGDKNEAMRHGGRHNDDKTVREDQKANAQFAESPNRGNRNLGSSSREGDSSHRNASNRFVYAEHLEESVAQSLMEQTLSQVPVSIYHLQTRVVLAWLVPGGVMSSSLH
jgi:hypothetical protein